MLSAFCVQLAHLAICDQVVAKPGLPHKKDENCAKKRGPLKFLIPKKLKTILCLT